MMPTILSRPQALWTPRRLPGLLLWLAADYQLPALDLAASFNGTDEQLTATNAAAPNTTIGDDDFFVVAYFTMTTPGVTQYIVLRGTGSGATTLQYSLRLTSANVLRGEMGDASGAGVVAIQDTTVLAVGEPHMAILYHDAVNNLLGLSLDGAAPITVATAGKVANDLAGTFRIGARASSSNVWNGAIGPVAMAKDPPGGIAALLADLPARWWNDGLGLPFAAITGDEKTAWGLVLHVPCNEVSDGTTNVNRTDLQSGYVFTSNNTVPSTAGMVYAPGVALLTDRSSAGNDATQGTAANRPTWTPATFGTKPGLVFDGTNDALALTDALAFTGDFTVSFTVKSLTSGAYLGHSTGTGKLVQTDSDTLTVTNDADANVAIEHTAIDGDAHDVTIVREDDLITVYIDGEEGGSGSGTLGGTITVNRIGVVGTTTTPLSGAVADVVIYDRAYT